MQAAKSPPVSRAVLDAVPRHRLLRRVGIAGTGAYLPPKVLTNHDLEKMVDTNDEWITTRTGIKERRLADRSVATSDMAVEAARRALASAGVAAADIDLIVCGTFTPDHPMPSAACLVQAKLGAVNAGAFDINAACSGFLYALNVGWRFVAAGPVRRVLVIGAESLSRVLDYTDRNSCILFGDGAGAAVLQETAGRHEILYSFLGSQGDLDGIMVIPAGGSRMPASAETVRDRLHNIRIRGREVYKFAVSKMVELVEQAAAHAGVPVSDIALVIPHQVNLRIIESAAEKLGLPLDRFAINLQKYGNTSAASVPITLDEVARAGRLKQGDFVVMAAFGAGLTWASAAIRW